MIYKGRVKDGAIVLDGTVHLPEGAEVAVEVAMSAKGAGRETGKSGSFKDRYKDFLSEPLDLPADAASQVDHYLYGTPKK